MPELPDVETYLHALRERVLGQQLRGLRVTGIALLRTFDPPPEAFVGRELGELRRIGKRLAFGFEDDLWAILHLMIAGRLRWSPEPGASIPRKLGLAALDWPSGTLVLTEAGTKKRASLHLHRGPEALAEHDRGGIEPLDATLEQFSAAITRENRTLKRALTDQRLLSGIGNAYSDEILHRARLSPVKRTSQLDADERRRLHTATRSVLREWTERLIGELDGGWPEKVTAFRDDFAVHGRYEQPCPVCGTPVQRIRYADNETNYCPSCQTEGRLLADRSLSRILKDDWPRTVEELEG